MRIPLFSRLLQILICSLTLVFAVSGQCLGDQRSYLLELKNSLEFDSGYSTKLVSWNESVDCCSWEGVTCSEGRVVGLYLDNLEWDEPQNLEVERMSSYLLKALTKKQEVDAIIRDTIDKILVLCFGRASDPVCLQLDDVLYKSAQEVSIFASVALVDIDSNEIQVYVKYFDITFIPSTVFFFNAHHMKMEFGTADHTKWVGAFHKKQDFIDVVEAIYSGAMKGKLIVSCPLPPE